MSAARWTVIGGPLFMLAGHCWSATSKLDTCLACISCTQQRQIAAEAAQRKHKEDELMLNDPETVAVLKEQVQV